jgi:hypothetical protein
MRRSSTEDGPPAQEPNHDASRRTEKGLLSCLKVYTDPTYYISKQATAFAPTERLERPQKVQVARRDGFLLSEHATPCDPGSARRASEARMLEKAQVGSFVEESGKCADC